MLQCEEKKLSQLKKPHHRKTQNKVLQRTTVYYYAILTTLK